MKNPKIKHIVKIIKISTAALLLAAISVSCGNTAEYDYEDLEAYSKTHTEATAWDLNAVNTASTAEYLSPLEKDVLLEINKARTNPRAYAALYLLPSVKDGNASEAMKECIIEMKDMKALKALQPGKGLTLAAQEWVRLQGPSEYIGHDMNLRLRLAKYCYFGYYSENISYGYDDARTIVIRLLEDDKVPSRGHRKIILSRAYTHVGIGCGTHKRYRYMCVQDFAERYKDKQIPSNNY